MAPARRSTTKRPAKPAGRLADLADLRKVPSLVVGPVGEHLLAKKLQPTTRRQDVIRFLDKVSETPTGCLEWTAESRDGGGYGLFWYKDRSERAHRVAVFFATGQWPDEQVMHACDNPPCVNLMHLALGSHAENMADMREKGRGRTSPGRQGSGNPAAKLTEADVEEIRRMYADDGRLQREIAEQFGVVPATISMIVRGLLWPSEQ